MKCGREQSGANAEIFKAGPYQWVQVVMRSTNNKSV